MFCLMLGHAGTCCIKPERRFSKKLFHVALMSITIESYDKMQTECIEIVCKKSFLASILLIGPSVLRVPAEQTKVATVLGN